MSEKRFTYGETIDYNFFDVFEEKKYLGMVQRDSTKIVDRLNEQQAIIEAKDKEIEESKITIQLYETDVSMRDNFLKSKGLYDEFLQCIWTVNE